MPGVAWFGVISLGRDSFRPGNLYIGRSNLVEIVNALVDARLQQ